MKACKYFGVEQGCNIEYKHAKENVKEYVRE
jgi:hypothetical protein